MEVNAGNMLNNLLADLWTNITINQKTHALIFPDYDLTDFNFEKMVNDYDITSYLIMVKDRVRMEAYQQAIQKYAKDKVILEIGTGALTPLARICVEAGAKKVYAIEANQQAAEIAIKGLERDGLQDKIEIIEGFSTEIDALSEKADILVHELIGKIASDEGMAKIVADAKKKFLKPEALFIPTLSQVYIAPVNWNNNSLSSKMFQFYGDVILNLLMADLSTLERVSDRYFTYNFPHSNLLTEPLEYEKILFPDCFLMDEKRKIEFVITEDRLFNGFLLWNQITTSPDIVINCFQGTHWPATFLSFYQKPIQLYEGDVIVLDTYKDLTETTTHHEFSVEIMRDQQPLKLERKVHQYSL
jgi:PRMT5 arginine-N-methyltransferase